MSHFMVFPSVSDGFLWAVLFNPLTGERLDFRLLATYGNIFGFVLPHGLEHRGLEFRIGQELLETDGSIVYVKPEHIVTGIGEDAAGAMAAAELTRWRGPVKYVIDDEARHASWACVLRLLRPALAAQLALASPSIARHLSTEQAVTYANLHPTLTEVGYLM